MGTGFKPVSGAKKTVQLSPKPRKKSAKEHVLELVDVWDKAQKAKASKAEDADLRKAIDASLALEKADMMDLEFHDAIDISMEIKEKEDSEFEQAILASKASEGNDKSDL